MPVISCMPMISCSMESKSFWTGKKKIGLNWVTLLIAHVNLFIAIHFCKAKWLKNHRITECFGLEGTFKGHLAQSICAVHKGYKTGVLFPPSILQMSFLSTWGRMQYITLHFQLCPNFHILEIGFIFYFLFSPLCTVKHGQFACWGSMRNDFNTACPVPWTTSLAAFPQSEQFTPLEPTAQRASDLSKPQAIFGRFVFCWSLTLPQAMESLFGGACLQEGISKKVSKAVHITLRFLCYCFLLYIGC